SSLDFAASPLPRACLRVSAPPRQNHTLAFPLPFHHGFDFPAASPLVALRNARPLRTEGHHPPLPPPSSSLVFAAPPRLSPRLRASASKSHSRVSPPIPPRF